MGIVKEEKLVYVQKINKKFKVIETQINTASLQESFVSFLLIKLWNYFLVSIVYKMF